VSAHRIAGWAQCREHPEAPVCLNVYAGGKLVGQVLANRYREDLERAGIGSGRHSFELVPPPGTPLAKIDVRRSLDGAQLESSCEPRSVQIQSLQPQIDRRGPSLVRRRAARS
jgi:hypothetical protein